MTARLWLAVELAVALFALALAAPLDTADARGADRARDWCASGRCEVAAMRLGAGVGP